MKKRDALKLKVGDVVRMSKKIGGQSETILAIDNGPGNDKRVAYPLFKTYGPGHPGHWTTYKLIDGKVTT